MPDSLGFLGLARRAGQVIGDSEQCRAAKRVFAVITAADAARSTRSAAVNLARERSAVMLETPFTKNELGAAIGRGPTGVAVVTDAGFARALAEKLAQQFPDGPAAKKEEDTGEDLEDIRYKRGNLHGNSR